MTATTTENASTPGTARAAAGNLRGAPLGKLFTRLLVPIDFSENSMHALRMADMVARQFDAAMHLVHVVERSPLEAYGLTGYVADLPVVLNLDNIIPYLDAVKDEMAKQLAALATKNRGGPCTYETRSGNAVQQILTAAEQRDCSAIVICTHGRTGLSRLVMGSVAERIVRMSPIPVLSVRAQGLED